MTPERWKDVEDLYRVVRDPEKRAAALANADPELRREVEALLQQDEPQVGTMTAAVANVPFSQIGPYKIEATLGKGGMGEVFRAYDTRLRRTVAIKILPRDKMADPDRKERFLREARSASALNHPNIVTVHDIANENGIDCLVLEYVPGKSLDQLIRPKGLTLAEVLGYAAQITNALGAAHAAGIVHRDIKPSNILVTPDGRVKVLDFGLAKLEERGTPSGPGPESETRAAEPSLTEAGAVMGTVAYMSPEQARAEKVDARTDLFSFGALLYEVATGRRAFPKALDWTVPPTESLQPELRRVVLKLLEVDRDLRYQTAADVAADFKRLQRAHEARRPSRRWWMAAAAAPVTLAMAAAVVYLWPPPAVGRDQWVQLTNFPDSVSQPALSPDGRMLAFIRGPDTFYTRGQVYIKMLPAGEPVQLTRDNFDKMSPVFSPDSSRIAYTTVDEQASWNTWVVPVLGGQPQPWLANAAALTWTDPQHVLFSEIKKSPHMAVVAAEESRIGQRDVYVPPHERGMAHRSYPSPDGQWVLVVEMDDGGAWAPCRVVPMDGSSSGRQVGPPGAGCTFAAWSRDGKWMYLSSGVAGAFHTWRQRFPDGRPEQITSGPTEEEGVVVAQDGRSFITAVALKQSSVWVHDSRGDRQISLEGYAVEPNFTPDGRRLCYRVLKGAATFGEPGELWIADLDSGRSAPLLTGFSVFDYDISHDGRQVVVHGSDPGGRSRLWLAALDGRTPPRQIPNVEGRQPRFGPDDEVFFRAVEGSTGFAYRVHQDGTALRKAIEQPVYWMGHISHDGQWLVAASAQPGKEEALASVAFPLNGGPPVTVFAVIVDSVKWSRDGKALFTSFLNSGKTYVVPLPAGRALPSTPASGFQSEREIATLSGVRVVEAGEVTPGQAPDIYAYSRQTVQRNLYRIPIP